MNFSRAFKTYRELIKTGEIRSMAEGEYIFLEVRGNISGDILVFIGPHDKSTTAGVDVMELINSDTRLEEQRKVAFKSLQEKFDGLTSLPESFVRLFIIGIIILYVWWQSDSLIGLFTGKVNLAEILSLFPLIVVSLIKSFLVRTVGFSLLKPILTILIWSAKLIRMIRNRKVKELQY